jgi:hypothetical protein
MCEAVRTTALFYHIIGRMFVSLSTLVTLTIFFFPALVIGGGLFPRGRVGGTGDSH